MELVFESDDHGEAIINRLAQDPIAGNLLLLYSLHPDDLETRILKALDDAKARLRKHNGDVEVISIHDGTVQLRLLTSGSRLWLNHKEPAIHRRREHLRIGARSDVARNSAVRKTSLLPVSSLSKTC